jgi:hypothetical protein
MLGRKRTPIGLVAALLVLGLVSLGVAQGLWSKNLVLNGVVETGDLNVDWTGAACSEFHPWNPPIGSLADTEPGEVLGKDVGSVTWEVDPDDAQIMHITVRNSYPSYSFDCQVEWENNGTIPVNLSGFTVWAASNNLNNCTVAGTTTKLLNCDELTVVFVDGIDDQIDPCRFDPLACTSAHSLRAHVEQPAEQNATYQFSVMLCVAQWNEQATYEQCTNSEQHEGPSKDRIIDADGTATAGDGVPGAVEVSTGDPLSTFPVAVFNNSGLDGFDNDGDGLWTFGFSGDDLHLEGPTFCAGAIRDADHDLGIDCKVLDHDGSLVDQQPVSFDLEVGASPDPRVKWYDANGNGSYDDGEDIVLDVNNDGVFN